MKRLGAGMRDAEEIKEHEFFAGVNWDDVYNRKIKPPKPELREIKPIEIPYAQIYNELKSGGNGTNGPDNNEDENKLPGWSFVTPNNDCMKNNVICKAFGEKQ